jgi:hypothetical protein
MSRAVALIAPPSPAIGAHQRGQGDEDTVGEDALGVLGQQRVGHPQLRLDAVQPLADAPHLHKDREGAVEGCAACCHSLPAAPTFSLSSASVPATSTATWPVVATVTAPSFSLSKLAFSAASAAVK